MSSSSEKKEISPVNFQRKESLTNNILVLFSHGWDLGKTFNIQKNDNSEIILLKNPLILHEDINFNHIDLISKTKDDKEYLSNIFDYLDLFGNEVCIFDNKEYPNPPDMLLSISKKATEITGLYNIVTKKKITDLSSIKNSIKDLDFDFFAFTLSELVSYLKDDFLLVVFACRFPLNENQSQHIKEDFLPLSRFLKHKQIKPISSEEGIQGLVNMDEKPLESNETRCKSVNERFGEIKGEYIQKLREERKEIEERERIREEEMLKRISSGGPPRFRRRLISTNLSKEESVKE
jgi:hypothetical protein